VAENSANDAPAARMSKLWIAAAAAAALIGAFPAVTYAVAWFNYTKGDCGVVRVYEHAFGAAVVGGWLTAAAVGVLVAVAGQLKKSRLVIAGAVISVAAAIAMALMCTATLNHIKDMDFPAKSTDELLKTLRTTDKEHRDLAAIELGRRKAPEAADLLCDILEDASADTSVRHAAAVALGGLFEPPAPPGADTERAVSCLIKALKSKDPLVQSSAAYALGCIGDPRALEPLIELLRDKSCHPYALQGVAQALGKLKAAEAVEPLAKHLADETCPSNVRQSIAWTLGEIGGDDARAALEKAKNSKDQAVKEAADYALDSMDDKKP